MHTNETKSLLDVFWHQDVLLHDTGAGLFENPASPLLAIQILHPEGPDRVRNMKSVLERAPSAARFAWHAGRHATEAELTLFHTAEYVRDVREKAIEGARYTATTLVSPGSWPGLLAAAGTTLEAATRVLDGSAQPAFALVRPPGHHAAPAVADGYCFFNHVAIAAQWALNRGIRRVAIVDWDVHHGNGTQEGFYDRADVLTISLHMDHGAWGSTHPQTGGINERGRGVGRGFNLNVPLPMGSTDHAYLLSFDTIVAPRLRAFAPELLVIASGVDGGQFDPNGRQLLTTRGFHTLARKTRELADELCQGRLLIVQEGGYNPAHSAFCVLAAVEGFAGIEQSLLDPLSYMPQFESRSAADISSLLTAIKATTAESALGS
jgi:acetoin utilization deacetylase AcuC-like enzyme